jgi:hypothetical protein
MRIGLKLLDDKGGVVLQRWSIFAIAKLAQVNVKDPEGGTYVWDIHGDCFESPMPIYDIENACAEVEQKMLQALIVLNNKVLTRSKRKTTRR